MADMGMLSFQTPEEVALARKAAEDARNMQMSQMGLGQSARYGMLSAGSALGNAVGAATGYVDPNEARAQKTQQVMSSPDSDLNTSKGMLAKAAELRTIDPRLSMQLLLKGRELEKQEAAAALAARKQDFIENEALQFKRDQLLQQAELKKLELEQREKDAQLRSEDSRYSADQRKQSASEATAMRGQIAQLMAEMKRLGIESKSATSGGEKPMTPAQIDKKKQLGAKSSGVLRSMDDDLSNMTNQANAIANHPSLWRSTGVMGVLPSMPGGGASDVDGLIDEFRASVKKTGLNLARQGGGIGSMTEREWPIVEGMVASIKPGAGGEVLKSQMDKVLAKIEQIRQNAYQTHNEAFDDTKEPKVLVTDKPVSPKPAVVTPIYASNGKVRIMSTDGGKTWKPVGAK